MLVLKSLFDKSLYLKELFMNSYWNIGIIYVGINNLYWKNEKKYLNKLKKLKRFCINIYYI